MLAPSTILQNRYRVWRELGHGGMGTVYEALDQRVNCIVALKETAAADTDESRRAFEREASLLGNLRHAALPKVTDYFSEGEADFLVMEFIPGYDLAELLDLRGSPFAQAQVLRWADELLRVLEYLHGQQPPVLHRDIKPSNLKLTKQGEMFLLDFGLAKGAVGQMPTFVTSRSVRGYTPVYASLEQIHGHGTDARSDLYSLGATLYHLLTGIPPVDAPTRFHAIEDDEPDPLQLIQQLNPMASANVAGIIHQAIAIARKQRPASATEMRKALRNAAEEDERTAAEEEYRRAEERRRQREEERRKAAEEAAHRAEEGRALQEAATRKKKDESEPGAVATGHAKAGRQRREAEEKEADRMAEGAAYHRPAEEAALARAEEEAKRKQAELPSTIASTPAPTVAAPEIRSFEKTASPPAIKTIPAPPPERLITNPASAAFGAGDLPQTNVARSKRVMVAVAAVVAVVTIGAISVWLGGIGTKNSPSSGQQPASSTSPNRSVSDKPATMTPSSTESASTSSQKASQNNATNSSAARKPTAFRPTQPPVATKRTGVGGVTQRQKRALNELNRP